MTFCEQTSKEDDDRPVTKEPNKKWQHPTSLSISKYCYSQKSEIKYTEEQQQKILKTLNSGDENLFTQYKLSKQRLKNFTKWLNNNGSVKSLTDIENIEGFTKTTANKFFHSILDEESNTRPVKQKIKLKGQILYPNLSAKHIEECKTVLAVYTTVNSVCCSLVEKDNYKLVDWQYYSTEFLDAKRIQITDILDMAWHITKNLPQADIYVMKAEPTSLRAAGSDPTNAKVLAVNLQKSQMIAMMIALLNARRQDICLADENKEDVLQQKVYFLRSTLPFRLFGTLIGNERISSNQTIETLLPSFSTPSTANDRVYIPSNIITTYRKRNELEQDMLGRCLFLLLTFMDLCVYNNEDSIRKLLSKSETT